MKKINLKNYTYNKNICYLLLLAIVALACNRQQKPVKLKSENIHHTKDINTLKAPKDLNIFELWLTEKNKNDSVGFISLSDIVPFHDNMDLIAMPDSKNTKYENVNYIVLSSTYRQRFFNKTKICEEDTVFIYDYSTDVILKFIAKDLNIAAVLTLDLDDVQEYLKANPPIDIKTYYQIGFEINRKFLKEVGGHYRENALAYIGKQNPFEKGQIKPVVWSKINANSFPKIAINTKYAKKFNAYRSQDAYKSDIDSFTLLIQNFSEKDSIILARRLLVLKANTNQLVYESYYYNDEGTGLAPLNNTYQAYNATYQWTGKLFRNKPPVLFGFEFVGYGCPSISFLGKNQNDIYIKCDNRN